MPFGNVTTGIRRSTAGNHHTSILQEEAMSHSNSISSSSPPHHSLHHRTAAPMEHYVCQERYGISISKHGNQTERVARFLKPCAKSSADAERISIRAHLLFEEMSSRDKGWPKKLNFRGWVCPQKNWDKWVEKLEVRHSIMWKQIGIYDAIMSSCCEIRRNKEIVLGLVEFWCSEMNTFVFPWGEATITLEDVMILGGFSVLGEPLKKSVNTGDLNMAVDAMRERKSQMSREKSKKADHGAWKKHFMENDSKLEHVAFLSLWLSRYVFPLPTKETISKDVFPIAAHLAEGTQLALAPAFLASLYKNLSLLKKKALDFSSDEIEITVFAPFQLVLLWAFEHFPHLVQTSPNVFKPGEPRAARWSKVICKMDKSEVNTIFISGECFKWRPYAADISNWNHSSYYRVEEHLEVDSGKNSDEDLQCYLICMTMSYLVGLDCQERYMPYRVAMQFGMDQDLPGEFSGLDFDPKDVKFFVPPRSFEPGVSSRYFEWWNNSEFMCRGKVPNVLRRSSDTSQMPPREGGMSSKDYHTPSVATKLKNSETVSWSSMKYEVTEVRDDEQEYDKWCNNSEFMCGGKVPNVLRRSSDTSQMPPGEGEMSSKDYHTPSVATTLKNSETVSPASMKYEVLEVQDDKWSDDFDVLIKPVCESGFPAREARNLGRRSPSIEEVKIGGGCYTSAKSFGSGSPECSTPHSVDVRSCTLVTSKISPSQRFQDCVVVDHVALTTTPKKMANDSKEIDDNRNPPSVSRHRASGLSSSDCKGTISMINGNIDEDCVVVDHVAVTATPKKLANDSKEIDYNRNPPSVSRHRASGLSSRATSDEIHPNETIRKRKLSASTEESSDCKETISMINGNIDELQGECVNAAMDVDERDFEIQQLDLEKRIEKLEKLMGISPDRG